MTSDLNLPFLLQVKEGVHLHIKVRPSSSKNQFKGLVGDRLKINVAAAPVKGAANAELLKFLAKQLDLDPKQLSITSGETSELKTILATEVDLASMTKRLSRCVSDS